MRKLRSLLVAAALVAGVIAAPFAGQAQAAHNNCGGTVTPLGLEVGAVPLPGGFYLDVRHVVSDSSHLYSVWVYEEANGNTTLQRGGDHWILGGNGSTLGFSDPCNQSSNPDRIWF